MADINLLQNQIKDTTFLSDKRARLFTIIMSVVLSLVIVGGIAIYLATLSFNSKTKKLVLENEKLQQKINNEQEGTGEAKSYQARLSNIAQLLKNHSYTSFLMEELDKKTYQKAKYLTFDAGPDTNKLHIEGEVDNYNDLGKLLLGLSTSEYFKNVRLLSVLPSRGASNSYVFSVDMNAAPEIFINKNK